MNKEIFLRPPLKVSRERNIFVLKERWGGNPNLQCFLFEIIVDTYGFFLLKTPIKNEDFKQNLLRRTTRSETRSSSCSKMFRSACVFLNFSENPKRLNVFKRMSLGFAPIFIFGLCVCGCVLF